MRKYLACTLLLLCLHFVSIQAQVVLETPYTTASFDAVSTNTSLPVGTTPAVASVDNGSSSYNIPLQIPAGTNGVNPEIAINYNSFGSDGHLGIGWGLSGLSEISRGVKTIYHDGKIDDVDLDASDALYCSGSRLVETAPNTYVKEMNDYSTITSHGSFGSGPQYFEVETKFGVVYQYGNGNNAFLLNENGTEIMVWKLNRISYKDGNYIDYHYENADRDIRITSIKYTGNTNTGLLPYNEIKFFYGNRGEFTNTTYQAENSVKLNNLLERIEITTENSELVKKYHLTYAEDHLNIYLKQIQESGSDGTFLNPTVFKYGDIPITHSYDHIGFSSNDPTQLISADLNSDGYSDLLKAEYQVSDGFRYIDEIRVYENLPSSINNFAFKFSMSLNQHGIIPRSGYRYNFYASDFTGEGRDDIGVGFSTNNPNGYRYFHGVDIYVLLDDMSGVSNTISLSGPSTDWLYFDRDNGFLQQGDFNGDGVSDFIVILCEFAKTNYKAFIYYGNVSTDWEELSLTGPSSFTIEDWGQKNVNVLDIDGNGKSELMITNGMFSEIFEFEGTDAMSVKGSSSGFPTEYHLMFFGDFNGDRKTDMLVRAGLNGGPWFVARSDGDGFIEEPFTFYSNAPEIDEDYMGELIILGDYNGDGRADIARGLDWQDNLYIQLYYSKGDTFTYDIININAVADLVVPGTHDFNGDGRSDIINRANAFADAWVLSFRPQGEENLLQRIKNGHGHEVEFRYDKMNFNATYFRTEMTAHPVNTVELPMRVVSRFLSTDHRATFYKYYDAKIHKEGKGFLGFEKIIKNQIAPATYEELYYSYEPNNFTMYLDTVISRLWQTNLLTTSMVHTFDNTLDANGDVAYFTHHVTQTKEDNHLQGKLVIKSSIYDDYGNVTSSTTDNNGIESQVITTTYGQYGSPIPSSPTLITTDITRSGQATFSTDVSFTYNSLGQILTQTQFPNLPKQVSKTYTYNTLGNVETTTITSPSLLPRSSSVYYDGKGRHITSSTNTLGQISYATYDAKWAKPLTTTSIGGQVTSFQYDAFGRKIKTTYPQGYDVDEVYTWEGGNAVYALEMIHPAASNVKTYFDRRDREVQKDQVGYTQTNTSLITYDNRGNVSTTTTPSGFTASYVYDDYNRNTSMTNDYGTTSFAYTYQNGDLTTVTTNSANQVSSSVIDATGKVVSSTDYGGTQNYTYESHGGLASVTNANATLITNTYDLYGRQTSITDIDAGTIGYEYDAFGQLIKETSPSNQITDMVYDVMGRLISRVEPEGTTLYSFYPTGSGEATNLLHQVQGFFGDVQTYTYDSYGRTTNYQHDIDNHSFGYSYTYDQYNRPLTKTFPTGFELKYAYDANGYTQTIHNGDLSMLLYECMMKDELDQDTRFKIANSGSPTEITYHHNYITQISNNSFAGTENTIWDYASGNLTSRERVFPYKSEDFTYDNLNRLKTYKVNTEPQQSLTYADNGNILTKTDVGGNYSYDNTKIHAINGVDVPDYSHISIYNQQVSYTSFQQPRQISQNDHKLDFFYGADRQRIKSIHQDDVGAVTTKYYLGDYEVVEHGGNTYHVHYISSGQHLTNIVVRDQNGDTQYSTLTDYQGSIRAVHDWAVGGDSYDLSFDPWGRRRDPVLWNYTSIPTYPVWLSRGYTSHEHLDDFNIINMNGRLYDPILARMLSPDNEVKFPHSTQNYNRYSYVLNNPLRYIDPTGEEPVTAILIGAAIGAAIGVTTNGIKNISSHRPFFKGAVKPAVFGAISGAVSAGIGSLATSALSSGYSQASVNFLQAFLHGYSGAIYNIVDGSNPVSGFASGAISSYTGSLIGDLQWGEVGIIIGSSVSGGVGASISGGSFLDGLRQGLITGGLNHAMHVVSSGDPDPPTKQKVLEYWAGELIAGNITPGQYLNVYILLEEGSASLIRHILSNYKSDIVLSIVPGGRIAKGAAKTSGWVKRSIFNSLDPAIQKKVQAAIKNGIVSPIGKQGIIKLTKTEAAKTGFTHKIKILGKGGDLRIYGNQGNNGHIFFEKAMGH